MPTCFTKGVPTDDDTSNVLVRPQNVNLVARLSRMHTIASKETTGMSTSRVTHQRSLRQRAMDAEGRQPNNSEHRHGVRKAGRQP